MMWLLRAMQYNTILHKSFSSTLYTSTRHSKYLHGITQYKLEWVTFSTPPNFDLKTHFSFSYSMIPYSFHFSVLCFWRPSRNDSLVRTQSKYLYVRPHTRTYIYIDTTLRGTYLQIDFWKYIVLSLPADLFTALHSISTYNLLLLLSSVLRLFAIFPPSFSRSLWTLLYSNLY